MKKKETLYIYTRISSRSQEDGSSLETQKELGIKKSKGQGKGVHHPLTQYRLVGNRSQVADCVSVLLISNKVV